MFIWDLLTGERVRVLRGHYGPVRDVSWHPYLPIIASSSWDCTVKLWDFKPGAPEQGESEAAESVDEAVDHDDDDDDQEEEGHDEEDEDEDADFDVFEDESSDGV